MQFLRNYLAKHPLQHTIHFVLLAIFVLGILLRFYNAPARYQPDQDAIRDAIVAMEGARSLQFPLTGPFSSTGPYTFGPWYYYIIIVGSLLFPFPATPWVVMSILSLCAIFLMFRIGVLLTDERLGLLLAFITAIAPTQIAAGTGLSNISIVPFFVIATLYLFLKLLIERPKHPIWTVLAGISLGLAINAHYQAAGLLLLPLLVWLKSGWRDYKMPFLISAGIFLTFLPMLIFNLQTNWDTLEGMYIMYLSKGAIYVPNSWRLYLFDFLPGYLQWIIPMPIIIIALSAVGYVIYTGLQVIKKRLPPQLLLLFIVFVTNIFLLRYYWGERHVTYLYYLEPFLLIFLGHGFYLLSKVRYGGLLVIAGLAIVAGYMINQDVTFASDKQRVLRTTAQSLRQAFTNTTFTFYTCRTTNDVLGRGLTYVFTFDKKQKEEKRIGIPLDSPCPLPVTPSQKPYPFIPGTELVDFSPASQSALVEAGWQRITTKGVLDEATGWWRHERL